MRHQKLMKGATVNSPEGELSAIVTGRYKGSPIHFDLLLMTGEVVRFVTIVDLRKMGLTHSGGLKLA